MNFEDLFDKSNSIPRDGFGERRFDSSMFMNEEPEQRPFSSVLGSLFAGLFVLFILSFLQGTLLWVVFLFAENLEFLDRRLPWAPFVFITMALNLIRVLDRASLSRR